MAGTHRIKNTLYRAGITLGEWIQRVFNDRLQDECLKPELFNNLIEAKIIIEHWRKDYNTIRPHSSLRYTPSAPLTRSPFHINCGFGHGLHTRCY